MVVVEATVIGGVVVDVVEASAGSEVVEVVVGADVGVVVATSTPALQPATSSARTTIDRDTHTV